MLLQKHTKIRTSDAFYCIFFFLGRGTLFLTCKTYIAIQCQEEIIFNESDTSQPQKVLAKATCLRHVARLLTTCVAAKGGSTLPLWNQASSSYTYRSALLMGLSNWARPIPFQHSPSRWVVDIYQPHLVTCQVTVFCS
jgi:hypothetical protein